MITSRSKCLPRNTSSTLFSSLTVGPQLSKGHCNRRDRAICTRAEQISAAVTDPAFGDTVLPRTSEAGPFRLSSEALHRLDHFFMEVCAAIEDKVCGS